VSPKVNMLLTASQPAQRIAEARRLGCVTLATLSRAVGVNAAYISRVETDIQPPSDRLLLAIGRFFGLSGQWLRTGSGAPWQPYDPAWEASEAATASLLAFTALRVNAAPERRAEIADAVSAWRPAHLRTLETIVMKTLTLPVGKDTTRLMPQGSTKLEELIERVRRAVRYPGRQSELARHLGVARQQVSAWLAGKWKPSGETALLMLEWVSAEEVKQQSGPGGDDTPPEPETRSRRTHNDTTRSNPSGR